MRNESTHASARIQIFEYVRHGIFGKSHAQYTYRNIKLRIGSIFPASSNRPTHPPTEQTNHPRARPNRVPQLNWRSDTMRRWPPQVDPLQQCAPASPAQCDVGFPPTAHPHPHGDPSPPENWLACVPELRAFVRRLMQIGPGNVCGGCVRVDEPRRASACVFRADQRCQLCGDGQRRRRRRNAHAALGHNRNAVSDSRTVGQSAFRRREAP